MLILILLLLLLLLQVLLRLFEGLLLILDEERAESAPASAVPAVPQPALFAKGDTLLTKNLSVMRTRKAGHPAGSVITEGTLGASPTIGPF